jgi:polyketide biosynthesis acyl carrier protein
MKASKQDIFEIIKKQTLEVLIDVDPNAITIDTSLTELGANSVDRVEIVMYSMDELGLDVPRTEFGGVRDIQSLVELLHSHCQ